MRALLLVAAASMLALPLSAHETDRPDDISVIDYYVNHNPYRTPAQMARDQYRHPAEVLAFFGIQPHMTVTEQLPGWYTEIVAPMVSHHGKFIAVNVHPDNNEGLNAERRARAFAFVDNAISDSDMFGPNATAAFLAGESHKIDDNSVDLALMIRASHGMVYNGSVEDVLADYFRIIKPGGVLGVVQHRDDETSPYAITDPRGYMRESDIIDLVTEAGFVLLAKSEINANPRDVKTYEGGVWSLPPRLRYGDENRAYYQSIGESDRMTLKFGKPLE